MLYTEQTVRDNIRNREGKRVFYQAPGDTLTPGARDWLTREKIQILSPDQILRGHRLACGATMAEKPEHMTHLHSDLLVPKTHPRIALRGALDTLEAELLLCAAQEPTVRGPLTEILELARQILRCEVLDEPLSTGKLCGLTLQELRSHSHRPQDYYGIPHFMPQPTDRLTVLRLNRCRALSRQAELCAAHAFTAPDLTCDRTDLLQALNRISSMLYILQIKAKKE